MALQYGLIDAIGTFKDAVNKASELGAPKPTGNSNSSTNSNQISNMKIMQWLGFSQETEDKLSAEEKQSLASAEEKLTRMESENAVLKEQLQNANELTGDLKAEAKTKDAKIAELETKLAETPAVDKPATTEDKDPEIKEEDESQKAIDELPHNKELDSNPMFQGTETELKKN
jgi:small-conductance mechanosensitive channel